MKRIGSIIALLFMLCITLLPSAASAKSSAIGLPPVIDSTAALNIEELNDIASRLNSLKSKYDVDVVFVITDDIYPSDAQASADDYFDYNGYGPDGILYLVSPSARRFAFSTAGEGIKIFNQDALDYMNEKMLGAIKAGDYYGAASVYADSCGEVLETAASGKIFKKKMNPLYAYGGIFLIPLAAAFILMLSRLAAMKTAVKNDGAANYVKDNSMQVKRMNDYLMYSTVSRTEKPKENSSKTHTSSSGREHGGMSGSF